MRCPPEIADIIARILSMGLLRIRALGSSQNGDRCAVEADHLHNLPSLLTDFKPELLEFYWRVERASYVGSGSREDVASYVPLWNELAAHLPKENSKEIIDANGSLRSA